MEWLPASSLRAVVDTANARLVDLLETDERDPTSIVVANVHRIKGLEADCVLLASPTNDVTDTLLYVGISRAISQLVLIGPEVLAARVGLA